MDDLEIKISMIFSCIFVMILIIGGLWLIFTAMLIKIMTERIIPITGKVIRINETVRNNTVIRRPVAEYYKNGVLKEIELSSTKVQVGEQVELYIGETGRLYEPVNIKAYLISGAVMLVIGAVILRNVITMLL